MLGLRNICLAAAMGAGLFAAAPASAQFFFKPPDLSGARVTGAEPGIAGPVLPDATAEELRAALVWNLRAALNVAALQCQFEPTLLTLRNYNMIVRYHDAELKRAYSTLEKYFVRVSKSKKEGQTELDRFGTRVYSGFSTVSAQLTFCQTAGSIGEQIVMAGPGHMGEIAEARMRELRNSLVPLGEQQFPYGGYGYLLRMPVFPKFSHAQCWDGEEYFPEDCELSEKELRKVRKKRARARR